MNDCLGNGRRTSLSMPNGTTTSYSYDNLSRLTNLSTLNSQLQSINSNTYTYDSVGNKLSKQDSVGSHSYTYDNTYQLTQATHPSIPTEAFAYDAVGNRNNTSVDAANKLLQDSNASYQYDNNGNRYIKTQSDGSITYYSYDYEGRLTRVESQKPNGTSVAVYKYDPLGRRFEKAVTENSVTTTTRYLYDNEDIIAEYDANGNITTKYIHGLGIDEPLSMEKNGQQYYYHTDGLGSVTEITNSSGTVVQSYQYDSFGNIKSVLDPNFVQPYTFTGREYDPETGIYYYRERNYDQKTGTFISKDPIGFDAGDTNLYRYVKNNPVNFVDPLGLYGKDVHYDLTYQLALQAGFTEHDARAIAKYNQGTDDSFFTAWYYPFGGIQMHFKPNEHVRNKLDGGASEVSNWACLGEALHMLQDSHSHAGYKWYKLGHLKDGTNPDKFSIFSKRDILMIHETWAYLIKYRQIYYKIGKESK